MKLIRKKSIIYVRTAHDIEFMYNIISIEYMIRSSNNNNKMKIARIFGMSAAVVASVFRLPVRHLSL